MAMHPSIETAFRSLTRVLFGRELSGLQSYSKWLERDVRMLTSHKSALSDSKVYLSFFSFFQQTQGRVVTLAEGEMLGKKSISQKDAQRLSLSNAAGMLREIKLYAAESDVGDNIEVEEVAQHGYSSFCFHGDAFVYSKYCAYCMWPRSSEYTFGSDFTFSSKFCLKCYNSVNLSRCFEMSYCVGCSDCYFCHNAENCHDCMFCFNAKNLRNAVCNVELSRGEYMRIKKIVQEEIAGRLEKEKSFPTSIYSIGASHGKK
ncbi:MAG: hypothetical protein NT051_02990 [Candidatus Micrarchaeota archaeon]|nr:hypothetical protein [Candidatus Micrarchaeota archaeon]